MLDIYKFTWLAFFRELINIVIRVDICNTFKIALTAMLKTIRTHRNIFNLQKQKVFCKPFFVQLNGNICPFLTQYEEHLLANSLYH